MEEKKTTETPVLNAHNKEEHRPSHTCEHIVNQTMIRLFGCGRSVAAHIERKKSKLDYRLDHRPTDKEVKQLEDKVNEVIASHLPVTTEYITQDPRPLRPGPPARRCLGDSTRGARRRLRRMPLHRRPRGEHGRNRHLPHHQPRLGRGAEGVADAVQARLRKRSVSQRRTGIS